MLVYGTRLWFTPATELSEPLDVAARWLSRKVGSQLDPARFLAEIDRTFTGSHRVRAVATIDSMPQVVAIAYTHPDSSVAGRQWTLEVGLRRKEQGSDLECTLLLSTSEISARVASPVTVTRPGLVTELVRRCQLAAATQGVSLHRLDEGSAEGFRYVVFDERRQYSLVVLSPDRDQHYLTEPSRLNSLVLGLADVVVIPPGADTYWLARAIGQQYVPYRGAAKLIYPEARIGDRRGVSTRTITPDDAALLIASGRGVDTEILSLVTHRSNLPIARSHVSLQGASELLLNRHLLRKRDEAARSGDLTEYNALLEEVNADLETKVKSLEGHVDTLEADLVAHEDAERQLRFDNEALKQQLAAAGRSARTASPGVDNRLDVVAALTEAVDSSPTPEQCLVVLEYMFEDRLEILPDAWASARDSKSFRHGSKLFSLLFTLATDYWDSLARGRPDGEARRVFGDAYAAKESESVAKNRRAKARRTFLYRGQPLPMMKHLKIGVKDSVAETIRVHFEWIADERTIVIGHCGAHVPFG